MVEIKLTGPEILTRSDDPVGFLTLKARAGGELTLSAFLARLVVKDLERKSAMATAAKRGMDNNKS